ncbi:MAG: hypothetical protein NTX59_05140 [Elusimicrobia bacterium]|nr:hypothetical protein [Elusimicrobiota bacterium]
MGKYRYVILASVPFIVLCVFLISTTSNLPVSDQWALVPLLEKWYAGSLTLRDFITQYADHRVFFPRLIVVLMAAITHWNLYCEVAANLFMGILVCTILFYQIRKMEIFFKVQASAIYFFVSVFVFSVAQSDNWFCAQIGPFLCILSSIAGVIFLSSPTFDLKKFLFAIAAGIIATYSYANGLLFWIIGFLILCVRPLSRKKAALTAWCAISGLVAASYLWNFQKPPQRPSLLLAVHHPLQAAGYFFVFLGSPLLPFERFAALIGFFGLFCLTASIFVAYHAYMATQKNPVALLQLFPWFALAFFSIASAILVTIGRVGFGIAQATAPRYVTQSNLLWIALIVLTPIAAQSFMQVYSGLLSNIARNKVLQYVCLIGFFALQISVTKQKWFWGKVSKDELTSIGNALLAGDYNEERIKARIYAPGNIRDRVAFLREHRLALFRGREPNTGEAAAKPPPLK